MKRCVSILVIVVLVISAFCLQGGQALLRAGLITNASATGEKEVVIPGTVYTFDEDDDYPFSTSENKAESAETQTYGVFSIRGTEGNLTEKGTENGVPAYAVDNGSISIYYSYSNSLLTAPEDAWHLVSDDDDVIDQYDLENDIQKGALILQRSLDHKNWYNVSVLTNAFEDEPQRFASLYDTLDVEMINGCYYRLIVAYKTGIKTGSTTVLGINVSDNYDYLRTAEVYEFYAALENKYIETLTSNSKRYRLGETVKVSQSATYSGMEEIKNGDLHYGWDLGQFFISGFTAQDKEKDDGTPVFLKNVGDVVTLWFHLQQDINALNGDSSVTIMYDKEGSDQYFQTPTTIFGRGMLIIRYTDHENVKHDPVMYYDYLEANTTLGADTRVQLFEEGDYEVALDYAINKDGFAFLDSTGHYRISFKFKVRNANCMVYPFDVKTGAELTNSSLTENGFYLDLARSRYLKVYMKKEVWTEGMDGLVADTRFNTSAKDGDLYTDEGIYTITAKNEYTGLETVKRIYVGANPILKAYMTSNYSIQEIVQLVDAGATIYEDGSIEMPVVEVPTEPTPETTMSTESLTEKETTRDVKNSESSSEATTNAVDSKSSSTEKQKDKGSTWVIGGGIAVAVVGLITIGRVSRKKRSVKEEEK